MVSPRVSCTEVGTTPKVEPFKISGERATLPKGKRGLSPCDFVPLLMYTMATDTCDVLVQDNTFVNSRGYLIFKSGGLAELPETYRVIDNTVVGPTNKPLAYCVGKEKAAAEAAREKSIRSANRFISRMEDIDFCSAASAPTLSPFSPCGGR